MPGDLEHDWLKK